MEGWIKLHRKLVDWEWYTDSAVKDVFIDLLLRANHSDRQWRGEVVGKGELVTSVSSLAVGCGLSEQQVRTALSKLEKTGEIKRRATNKHTLIIVVNYEVYQGLSYDEQQTNNEQSNNQTTNNQQSNNKQITTNKNERIKELKNISTTSLSRADFVNDFAKYNEVELTEIYPIKPEFGLTTAEVDILYQYIENFALERYLNKIVNYNCNDRFLTIIKWAIQDDRFWIDEDKAV